MRVIQLLPTVSYGDAVGNDTLAIQDIIRQMGYETQIYAENIDGRLPARTAMPFSQFPDLTNEDVVIYHGSTGTELNFRLPQLGGRKIMIYHNITPPAFFHPYSPSAEQLTAFGLQGIENLRDTVDYCIADSEFNKSNLKEMGYPCPMDVCPVLIPFKDYERTPNKRILQQYAGDSYVNILFTGRVAPNKKQEDIIRAFFYYHTYYNKRSRLILVGSWNGMEKYYDRLCDYVNQLGLSDSVIFTGHIKFDEILAYYRLADVFLCMSEHEGFCVPLVEAMYFDVPIIAYRSTAIPDTLGGCGMLLESKHPKVVAAAIHQIISDNRFCQKLIEGQRQRLVAFAHESIKQRFVELLGSFLEKEGLG